MKICSIGNSFSQDAHRWLFQLAKAHGVCLETANLYIGGCSLQMHWENVLGNHAHYDLEWNGNSGQQKISIAQALELEQWDIVTVQQVSGLSGIFESYEPYLSSLASMIKAAQPKAKIYFHQTWAYETDSDHGDFVKYHHSQRQMYSQLKQVSEQAAQLIGGGIIPVGTVIQTLREGVPEFDYHNGGLSLCRDGFHLTEDYGRYAAAATWLHILTGQKIVTTDFLGFKPELLERINQVVNEI